MTNNHLDIILPFVAIVVVSIMILVIYVLFFKKRTGSITRWQNGNKETVLQPEFSGEQTKPKSKMVLESNSTLSPRGEKDAWISQNNVNKIQLAGISSYPGIKQSIQYWYQTSDGSVLTDNREQEEFIQRTGILQMMRDLEHEYNLKMPPAREDIPTMVGLINLLRSMDQKLSNNAVLSESKDCNLLFALLRNPKLEYNKLLIFMQKLETEIDSLINKLIPSNVRLALLE